ncbi:MAG: hypothetical protein U0514_01160 [Candidatus Andersenbacteria bacterium]
MVVGGGNLAASEALDLLAHTRDVRVNTNGERPTMDASWRRKLDRANCCADASAKKSFG